MKQERLIKMLENAQSKLIKANKSLERLNKELVAKQADKWVTSIVENDIKRKQREIVNIEKSIQEYREKLKTVQSIEEIPVLREFINNWKIKAKGYYTEQHNKLMEYKSWLEQQEEVFKQWIEETTGSKFWGSYSPTKEVKEKRKELKIDHESQRDYLHNNFDAIIITIGMYDQEWQEKINKVIEREAERKYISFLERIKKAVGKTLDCSGLYIGDNAEINGIVKGELGRAKVETIGAGGYNIQCYHYRVLVHILED